MRIGNPRQQFKLGSRLGNFIIIERTKKIHRPHHRGGSGYYYKGRCISCGYIGKKTLNGFRVSPGHVGCPALKEYQRKFALKETVQTFRQYINDSYVPNKK